MGEEFDIGRAIEEMREGKKVRRSGWNGKGMYVFFIPKEGWTYTNGRNDNMPLHDFIAMKTADDTVVPWLCSQSDLLAKDWQVVE